MEQSISLMGTYIWSYYICHRQLWLMAHQLHPDQNNPHLELGRFLQEHTYKRYKKSISLENIEIDLIQRDGQDILVGEIKKSSWNQKSALMQLAFYMKFLEEYGISSQGELLIPKEKKRVPLDFNEEIREELAEVEAQILRIIQLEYPPSPKRIGFCRGCAYQEFCWSDEEGEE